MAESKQFADRYWRYSLTAYATDAVQALCLRLQDEYAANVNLLLLGGFVGHAGLILDAQDWAGIVEDIAPFNQRYTQRIRKLRQRVQPLAVSTCYQQLKALELQAERLEQQIITLAYASRVPQQQSAVANEVLQNLLAYQASWSLRSAAAQPLMRQLAAALCRGAEIKSNYTPQ